MNWKDRGDPMPFAADEPGYGWPTVAVLAWQCAQAGPEKIAVWDEVDGAVSYAALLEEAGAVANGLTEIGLVKGDVISFQLPNWRETVAINIAASALGLIVNPIPPIYRGAELSFILRDSGSRAILLPKTYRSTEHLQIVEMLRPDLPDLDFVIPVREEGRGSYAQLVSRNTARLDDLSDLFEHRAPLVSASDLKVLMYTSGTTGDAKGVLHSHQTINATHADYIGRWQITDSDLMLMPSPVTHGTGYILGLELPFVSGAPLALMARWEPAAAIDYINRVGASLCAGATVFLKDLIDEAERVGDRLPSLRLFSCGGAAVSSEVVYRAAEVTERCRAMRVYGSTEAPLVTKGFPEWNELRRAAETDGKVSGYDVRIIDHQGEDLGPDRIGEILVRGAGLMVGYTSSHENNAAFDASGYFRTGDLGCLTSDGGLTITGRKKDLIIRGGENLSPKEIEEALERHPAIREAAVVAMPHPRLGEAVCAFVVIEDGAEAPGLMDLAQELESQGMARQKFPERLEYLEYLPRNPSGKVQKEALRRAIAEAIKLRF